MKDNIISKLEKIVSVEPYIELLEQRATTTDLERLKELDLYIDNYRKLLS